MGTNAAQGNGVNNPVSFFNDHALVRIAVNGTNGTTTYKYYDPSYGTGPFINTNDDDAFAAWESASIAGFCAYINYGVTSTIRLLWIEKVNTNDATTDLQRQSIPY